MQKPESLGNITAFLDSISIIVREVNDVKYEIGKRIKHYRELCGMSQKQLAATLGISNSRVSNWEHGINRPDADMLASICNALNISPSELLNVHLSNDNYTSKERQLIHAYRDNKELQKAIDILLGLDTNP